MNHFSFKFPNLNICLFTYSFSPIADANRGGADYMDGVRETAPPRHGSQPTKCFSPRWVIAWMLAALRPTKEHRLLQRRQNEATVAETPSFPMNELKGSNDSRKLCGDDTSFKVGVGCGLLYMIAASKNELSKMIELRKEMEMLLQNVKGELQSKASLLKLKQTQSDALACSITDVQEVSSSNSHLSIRSQTPYVQSDSKGNMVHNHFLEYNLSEQDECAEEISELQAEFEVELQRLQLYLDGEASFEDAQQERIKVPVQDSSSKSHSSSFDEIIMEPQGESSDVSFGVPPIELERRLHELLEGRLQERIVELESALECTTQKLTEKEIEVTWWKDTALVMPHVPETSRFTFPIDPESALKLSQV